MEVRHDTRLIEQAIEHVVKRASIPTLEAEARALEQRNRAISMKRIATAASVAVVAVGLAFAYKLFYGSEPTPRPIAAAPEPPRAVPVARLGKEPITPAPAAARTEPPRAQEPSAGDAQTEPPPPRGPIIENFTKFAERSVRLPSGNYSVTAGHRYRSEADENWEFAWCYTDPVLNDVKISVELAVRDGPASTPTGIIATDATLRNSGLSRAEAFALAAACPWSDRSFSIDEIRPRGNASNPFSSQRPSVRLTDGVLSVSGAIGPGFLSSLQGRPFSILEIDSIGGSVDEAMRAGNWLRANNKTVRAGQTCLSACTLVLASGLFRQAVTNARVGVHRFTITTPSRRDAELAQAKSSEIISYLNRMDVDIALFHAMANVPSEGMRYLTLKEMSDWRLLTSASLSPETQPLSLDPQSLAPSRPPLPGAPPSTSEFSFSQDTDAPGNDIEVLRDVDMAQCHIGCLNNRLCRAYTYNSNARWCFIKDRAASLTRFVGAVTAIRQR